MPFSEDDINTAYQLHELLHESGSRYVGEIGTESAEMVVFVVGQNPNPARITRSQAPSQPFHTLSIDYDAERRQVLCTWWTSTQAQLRHPDFLVWKKRNPNALSVFKLVLEKRVVGSRPRIPKARLSLWWTLRTTLEKVYR